MTIRELAAKWIRLTTRRESSPWLMFGFLLVAGLYAFSYINRKDDFDFYMAFAWLFLAILQFERIGLQEIVREKEQRIAELKRLNPVQVEKVSEINKDKEQE